MQGTVYTSYDFSGKTSCSLICQFPIGLLRGKRLKTPLLLRSRQSTIKPYDQHSFDNIVILFLPFLYSLLETKKKPAVRGKRKKKYRLSLLNKIMVHAKLPWVLGNSLSSAKSTLTSSLTKSKSAYGSLRNEMERNEMKWNETKWKSVVCKMRICSLRNENL